MRVDPTGAMAEGRLLPIMECDSCGETAHVEPRRSDGYDCGVQCESCWNREPGDSHYEDTGSVRHELQYADGTWGR